MTDTLRGLIARVFDNGLGRVALQGGAPIGYLAFVGPWDGCFGDARGVFSPLGASAIAGEERGKLASQLFESAAGELAEEGVSVFSVSRYAHDREVGESFVLNGFGIRCSDALTRLGDEPPESADDGVEIAELTGEAKREIDGLQHRLVRHLAAAPTFFPTDVRRIDTLYAPDEIRMFVARENGRAIGYMTLCEDGETFVSDLDRARNICGAYVDEAHRGTDVPRRLLRHIMRLCRAEGMEWLGVDCETLNPTALRFWRKHFDNYTYSYSRRIDERVTGYAGYLDTLWKA